MKGLVGFLVIILLIVLTANVIFRCNRDGVNINKIQDSVMIFENDTIKKL